VSAQKGAHQLSHRHTAVHATSWEAIENAARKNDRPSSRA